MSQARSVLPPAVAGPDARRDASIRRALLRLSLALGAASPWVRRAIDVVVSGAALVVLVPVFVVVGIALKLESPGPLLFPQERIGRHGRRFRLFKLRTMFHGADAQKSALARANTEALDGVRFKLKQDPRVTRVGRVLRKLSIDEFPQFWNVFIGDMTLVGPRPPVQREVALYDARALRRLEVRPGLTCLWQIGGRSDLSFDEQITLDLHYIDLTRPAEEIAIVAKTVPAVLTGRGAY